MGVYATGIGSDTNSNTPQERKRVAQVSSGLISDENNMPAVQIIPPLLQLYPDIEVEHADETSCLINRSENGQLITRM